MKKIRQLSESGQIRIGEVMIRYFIYRDVRARRLKMRWQPARGLIVVVPSRRPIRSAHAFIRAHPGWIRQQAQQWETRLSAPGVPRLEPGGYTMIKGRSVPIVAMDTRADTLPAAWDDGCIRVVPGSSGDSMESDIIELMKHIARVELKEIVDHYAAALDVTVKRMSIRDQRTRWGSWSSRGNISLNWRLIMLPENLIHYVVIHELIHHFHPNHSPSFWSTVAKYCPHWRETRNSLKQYTYLNHLFRSAPSSGNTS
ncbi:MAG TPA: SprT family zinc-dependent metalloprotease [bacterium]|nr:SprT family zinc-dependent metalloprotease [bacterium]